MIKKSKKAYWRDRLTRIAGHECIVGPEDVVLKLADAVNKQLGDIGYQGPCNFSGEIGVSIPNIRGTSK